MLLEQRHELGQKGDQAFGADEVGGGPRDFEGGLDGWAVLGSARPANRRRRREGRAGQQADGVLAVIAGGGDKLVEDRIASREM